MWIWPALEFAAVAVFSLLSVSRYTNFSRIPFYVTISLLVAVFIPSAAVALVPIDLLSSVNGASSASMPFYISKHTRQIIWRVLYWLSFALTWAVLPLLQSFSESGYQDPRDRLREALRANARYQIIVLVAGFVGFVYVIVTLGVSLWSLKSLVIALSYCYSLVMAIWLLGHGLINLPRRMWTLATPQNLLKHHYSKAVVAHDSYLDAQAAFLDTATEINTLARYKTDSHYADWIEQLQCSLKLADSELQARIATNQGVRSVITSVDQIDPQLLASLGRRLIATSGRYTRLKASWIQLVQEAAHAQNILSPRESSFRVRYELQLRPLLTRGVAVLCGVVSLSLFWSEIFHGTRASLLNLALGFWQGVLAQLVATLTLAYMYIATLDTLTRIRVFNKYALVRGHSDVLSLLFFATYACRLAVPLSYNFLILVTNRESVFQHFLGESVNLTPLGHYFSDWLPRLILLPALLTYIHFYDRVKDYLGFGIPSVQDYENQLEISDTEPGDIHVSDGRALINTATANLQNSEILVPNSSDSLANSSLLEPRQSDFTLYADQARRLFDGIASKVRDKLSV